MDITQAQIEAAVREAKEAAYEAADNYFRTKMNGEDKWACGFAWVNIWDTTVSRLRVTPRLVVCSRQRAFVRTTPRRFKFGIPRVWAYRMWTARKLVRRPQLTYSRSMDSQPTRVRV